MKQNTLSVASTQFTNADIKGSQIQKLALLP